MENISTFQQIARDSGGSIEVTIDKNVVKYEGISPGDHIQIWVRKLPKKE